MIKQLVLIFFLFCHITAYAGTQQVISGGLETNLNTAGTTQWTPWFSRTFAIGWAANEEAMSLILPTAGTLDDLRVKLGAAPDNGAGTQTYTFLFRIDAASGGYGTYNDTSLTCTVSEAETSCTNSNGFSVEAGDLVSFQHIAANTPVATTATWTLTWNPTVADESILLTNTGQDTASATERQFMGASTTWDASVNDTELLIPTGGTFKTMHAYVETQPGASGDTWTISLEAVDCTINFNENTCNSASDTQAVTQGDTVDLLWTEAGTVAATTGKTGIVFDPTTEGEWIIGTFTDDAFDATNIEYGPMPAGDFASTTTESSYQVISQTGTFATAMTIEDICALLETNVGTSPDAVLFTLRINGADSSPELSVTVDTSSPGNIGPECAAASVTIANDDLLAFETDPTGTPTAGDYKVSFTGFIPPSAAARRIFTVN
jgi:hypothetical protein